jgi:hypothetical protein
MPKQPSPMQLWLNIGDEAWASLDVAASDAHDTRSLRTRFGYRIVPTLSLGLEGKINVDAQGDCELGNDSSKACRGQYKESDDVTLLSYSRAGVFARYEWATGEISVSAGALGRGFIHDAASDPTPYVTVNWLTQF